MTFSDKIGKYDIKIIQGSDTSDFSFVLTEDDGTPIDLTGFTAACHIRPAHNSATLLDELTTENGRIVISSYVVDLQTFWRVTVKFPSATTSSYTFTKAVHDVELYNGGLVYRYLQGQVIVNSEATIQ